MIKINLATRKHSNVAVSEEAGGGGRTLSDIFGGMFSGANKASVDIDGLRELPLRKIALMVLVGFGAGYLLDEHKTEQLQNLEPLVLKAQTENKRLMEEAARTRNYKQLKVQLDADEFVLRKKIETIDKLMADRQVPPKMLLSLSTAIPSDVWLTDFRIDGPNVSFAGGSNGFAQISDFMKNLNENVYFTGINLEKTEQAPDSRSASTAIFELKAKRR